MNFKCVCVASCSDSHVIDSFKRFAIGPSSTLSSRACALLPFVLSAHFGPSATFSSSNRKRPSANGCGLVDSSVPCVFNWQTAHES